MTQSALFDMTPVHLKARKEKPLDDICRNRHGGNPESEEANKRTNKEGDELRILGWFKNVEATCEEMTTGLGMPHQTGSARCADLKKKGFLIKTGERRPTKTGSPAAVLRLTTPEERKNLPGSVIGSTAPSEGANERSTRSPAANY